jgi:hypothetical protein
MTIDGTNISTFGLKLLNAEGLYDLPARKKILSEPGNESKDIVFLSKEAIVTLLGRYSSVGSLVSNINAFETLLKTILKHDITLIGHNLTFTGIFDKGFEVVSFNGGKIAKVIASITITE